ncbi:MAG: DAK2 domain-containing protein [Christensenellales bacterium]
MITVLAANQLLDIFKGAKQNLLLNKSYVDELNVFPVPDGDTGTNMGLTITSTVNEAAEKENDDAATIISAMAKGALKGARGNSGVILSQIIKGMSEVIAEAKSLNTKAFAKALQAGANKAYEAVTHPKEGTILTVIRIVGNYAVKISSRTADYIEFFEKIIGKGNQTLAETPKMLPVLAKAGVVDSGGQGLMFILEGMYNILAGVPMKEIAAEQTKTQSFDEDVHDLENIQFAYCTEFFIINLKKQTTLADIDKFRDKLMKIGDCVLVIGDLEMVKVHVHTNAPDKALGYALQLGELNLPKIENMLEQNRALQAKKAREHKKVGLLAISCGEGFRKLFEEANADDVLEGGQTMNPSVEDIVEKVKGINADNVFVLPNNKNIILACEQAVKELDGCNLIIIPTTNMSQGFSAAIAYMSDAEPECIEEAMKSAAQSVSCIQITHSVRDTEIDGFTLKTGDIIALEDKVIAKGDDVNEVALEALADKDKDSVCVITVFYGDGVSEGKAEELRDKIADEFPDSDVVLYNGGQPHYSYFISLE